MTLSTTLLKTLLDRGILGTQTEIEARYMGRNVSGDALVPCVSAFTILVVHQTDTAVVFACADTVDGSQRFIPASAIVSIDGMDPARFAAIYGLSADGGPAKLARKRGPRSRRYPEAMFTIA